MEKPKILLIEDDSFLSSIYARAMENQSIEVILANSAEEGERHIERNKPDLIVLDILLPHMDGFEFLESLRARAESQHIPVLLLTNMSGHEDVSRAAEFGVSGFLIKAHTKPDDLVRKITSLLN